MKKSTDTLHRYLLHRLYPSKFQFEDLAEVVNSCSIFIPSGWDSTALVQDMEIDDTLHLNKFGKPPVIEYADEVMGTEKENETKLSVVGGGSNSDTTFKVTAYSEQSFLQRLMKKQQELERHSHVNSAGLRDIAINIGVNDSGSINGKRKSSNGSSGNNTTSGSSGGGKSSSNNASKNTNKDKSVAESSGPTSSIITVGKSANSGAGNTKSGDGNAKDNPKLIKNFFQSLLDPKGKKSSGSKRRSTRNSKKAPSQTSAH
jgi:hypothetical protein